MNLSEKQQNTNDYGAETKTEPRDFHGNGTCKHTPAACGVWCFGVGQTASP